MTSRYSIVLCGDFIVDSNGNLIITALVQNKGDYTEDEAFSLPPDYAPVLCRTKIYPEFLPNGFEFKGKSHEELEELVNRFDLLSNQEWHYVTTKRGYPTNSGDYSPTGSRLYF